MALGISQPECFQNGLQQDFWFRRQAIPLWKRGLLSEAGLKLLLVRSVAARRSIGYWNKCARITDGPINKGIFGTYKLELSGSPGKNSTVLSFSPPVHTGRKCNSDLLYRFRLQKRIQGVSG